MHLGDFGLDVVLIGFDGSLKAADFILDLDPFGFLLDGNQLFSKDSDLLLFNGDLFSVGLGVVLMSRSLASKVVALTLEVLLLFVNLNLGLFSGMSMSLSFLLMRIDLSDVNVLMVAMATSVRGNSFILLRFLLRIVSFSLESSVVVMVVIIDIGNGLTAVRIVNDLTSNFQKIFLISCHLSFEIDDLLIDNSLLLFFGN